MRTSCEIFAERGDAWDARVRPDFGLIHEPARAVVRTHPDGFTHVELAKDWLEFEDAPLPVRHARVYAPRPKPDHSARLAANRAMRARKLAQGIFVKRREPAPEPKREPFVGTRDPNEPVAQVQVEAVIPPCPRKAFDDFIAQELAENARRRREAGL